MALPTLSDWKSTRDALHQASQVVGAIRVAIVEPLPNALQYSVKIIPNGISSGVLPDGGELKLDFASFNLSYEKDGKTLFHFDASGFNQVTLMTAVLEQFKQQSISVEPSWSKIVVTSPFQVDKAIGADYAQVLNTVFEAMAKFRAHLGGSMTPLVLWPHHFDLSFMWFVTSNTDEHTAPHLNFGFAPFSDDIERPYFYAYGWGDKTGYVDVALDPPAQASGRRWAGLYAAYDDMRTDESFTQTVEKMLMQFHRRAIKQFD